MEQDPKTPETIALMRLGDRLAALLVTAINGDENRCAAHQVAMSVVCEAYRVGRADERCASQNSAVAR